MIKLIIVSLWILGTATGAVFAQSIHVIDGDTIVIGELTHRLHGIDTPEFSQFCKTAKGGNWPCGKQAVAELKAALEAGPLRCDHRGQDDYGRIISVCHAGQLELNAHLVRHGMAWAFTKYSMDYVVDEASARSQSLGIWQAPTQTAWDYRAQKWEVAKQEAPKGCPIKGNISKNGKIYHAPWSPWYSRTKVSINKGERWFCNEAEAVAAGWRAPYW